MSEVKLLEGEVMTKRARVPLNRTVDPETFDKVKLLAKSLECSEGEVIDRAVIEFSLEKSLVKSQEASNGEPTPEFRAHVKELVERVRALPMLEEIGTLLGHLLESRSASVVPGAQVVSGWAGPRDRQCKHCPELFAGPKSATICPNCKSSGHTNAPSECPRCTEGEGL